MQSDDAFSNVHWTADVGSVPVAALGGLALGGGARLGKNLLDLLRRPPTSGVVNIRRGLSNVSKVPIEVTPEQAEKLRRKGIKVKEVMSKAAAVKVSPNFWGGMGLGALGTGAAVGGWNVVDWLVDKTRKAAIESDIENVRQRIQRVIDDEPEEEDERTHAYMKAAEDKFFSMKDEQQEMLKEADVIDFIGNLIPWQLGPLLGGAAVVTGLAGYQQAKQHSGSLSRAKRLKRLLASRKARAPMAAMEPVVRVRGDEDEENELVEVMPEGRSPARQAAVNRLDYTRI